jgi:hypothetical protein
MKLFDYRAVIRELKYFIKISHLKHKQILKVIHKLKIKDIKI